MRPLAVTARLAGGISLPSGSLALDALLAAAVALRDGLPPASVEMRPIEIPVAREPGGRFHLASFSVSAWEEHEVRWTNRRFPIEQAQALAGPKMRRIQLSTGPCKSFRVPIEWGYLERDEMRWWCIGDGDAIRELLELVTHLGKRRAVGGGRVAEWTVEPVDDLTWPGFPVVRNGRALRPLPPDWPGLEAPDVGYGCLTFPYWDRTREQLVAMPEVAHA